MRTFFSSCLCMISLTCSLSFTAAFSQEIINVQELTEEMIHQWSYEQHPTIIQFPKDTILPLTFFVKGDLLCLHTQEETPPLFLHCLQTFYVTWNENELQFSLDLNKWKTFTEFLTGQLVVSLNTKTGQPSLGIGSDMNVREQRQ